MKKFKIIIAQGRESVDAISGGQVTFEELLNNEVLISDAFEFNTQSEIDAFMTGIAAVDGWENYDISDPIEIKS